MRAKPFTRLAANPAKRRTQLKRFLTNHAQQFKMDFYFEGDGAARIYRGILLGDVEDARKAFEQCDTKCCIGGGMWLLTGIQDKDTLRTLYKISSNDLFHQYGWPTDLTDEYQEAMRVGDFEAATRVGIKAIDYFAVK